MQVPVQQNFVAQQAPPLPLPFEEMLLSIAALRKTGRNVCSAKTCGTWFWIRILA